MENAPRDNNYITSKLACLNTDTVQGENLVPVKITNGYILTDSISTINFTMIPIDPKDDNYVGCWLFKGSDGRTYPAVATSEGRLLIDL